jgi:hypothetical protein
MHADRTHFALKALSLADLFNVAVGGEPVSGYRVELVAPDGPSTGGGRQAVQHVRLVAGGAATITVGAANPVAGTAELRTWEHLRSLHAQRFAGASLPIDRAAYNQLLERMRAFFGDQEMNVVLVELAPDGAPPPLQPSRALVLLPLALALALMVSMFVYLRH